MNRHDRQLLLLGPKRNQILELREVERYGIDSFGDPDYVSVYGMRPGDWYARGVRLLGRTAVECTRDALGKAVGGDVARIASTGPRNDGVVVIDPFAGSCNTLYWIQRCLPGSRGMGMELDPVVFDLAVQNLAALGWPIEFMHADHRSGLSSLVVPTDRLLIAFLAPPWGEALRESTGLDLRRTSPPVAEVVDLLMGRFAMNAQLCVIQVFERTDMTSIDELQSRFDWSALRIYDLDAPGRNHGILVGTKGWVPSVG